MLNLLILVLALALFFLYSPYFQKLEPIEYSLTLPIVYDGPMAVNDRLDAVEKLFENQIHWPESMSVHNGKIYTGLGDGRIVSILGNEVKTICRLGQSCEGQHEEHKCGRPLGMEFDKSGKLYVVDAYHGLFAVDVATGKKHTLVPSSKFIEAKQLTFLNGLALDHEDQVIYLTQSTSKWNISNVVVSIVEHDTSGRLLKYDIKKNIISVLKEDLSFPNGIVLSHDKQSVLVAEGNKHAIHKYYIKGSKKGLMEKLPIFLPGEPDNISPSKRGNYWVTIGSARTAASPTFYDRFCHYPLARKIFLMVHHILMSPVSSALRLTPSKEAKELAFELVNVRAIVDLFSTPAVIVEFNDEGNIIQSLHSPTGKVSKLSEVLEHDGFLYLGSWRNRFLGKVKL